MTLGFMIVQMIYFKNIIRKCLFLKPFCIET